MKSWIYSIVCSLVFLTIAHLIVSAFSSGLSWAIAVGFIFGGISSQVYRRWEGNS